MKQTTSLLVATIGALAFTGAPSTAQSCSQNTDPLTVGTGSVSCNYTNSMPPTHALNRMMRRYRMAADCPGFGSVIAGITFGINGALAGNSAGMQPLNVRLYTIPAASPLLFVNMTMQRDVPIMLVDQSNSFETVFFPSPYTVPAGLDVVAEIYIPDGGLGTTSNLFFIGANGLGQSSPSYLAAPACGINEPTDLAVVGTGFPNVHILVNLEAPPPLVFIGTNYCGPAVANSSGASAIIQATGSALVADNDVTLMASALPPNAFGYFLTSQTQGLVTNLGGGQGTLCLGGSIGRFVGPGLIQNSGTSGSFSIMIDLNVHANAGGAVAVAAGQTWLYQAWFRDQNPGVTSNLTDGLMIPYQ